MNENPEEHTTWVWRSDPRETAQVRFPDGRAFEAPAGTPLETYVQAAVGQRGVPIIAALVDGKLRELTYPIERDVSVTPLYLADSDGVRIYRRSLSFLLVAAVRELFPDAQIFVDYTLPFGGYFCQVRGRDSFTSEELARLKAHMQDIVEQDDLIKREFVPLEKAVETFQEQGEMEKVRLLRHRQKDYLALYSLRGMRDYFYGYMVPSTGYLRYFDLLLWSPGFVLQYPRRHWPTDLRPVRDYPQLTAIFREYGEWLHLLGVESVSELNEAIASNRIRELILVAEALHEQRIAQIAEQIARRREDVRVVFIAGPSAAGKTTFAKRLSIQLLAHGVQPFPLALDNFFVERDKTPRDETGEYDFESLEALDLALFNQKLVALLQGDEVQLPSFNFLTGRREAGDVVQLGPNHVVLVEGIHGLNPKLASSLPETSIFRIYVSALTQLNIDRHNRVPTTDTRLLRRIVRDATYRGYTAEETLDRWESVRRGEKRHIFPYQENADVMFNSALAYELAVLKPLAEPLLLQVKPSSPRRVEVKRLLAFLQWFEACGPDLIPDNSLLREFVGGSILRNYSP
ncbi:MAG TPA: nucleoside kinase [Chloroflexi bacterium]|nr:nucleoside kinase [Chloroflexota bacterium]